MRLQVCVAQYRTIGGQQFINLYDKRRAGFLLRMQHLFLWESDERCCVVSALMESSCVAGRLRENIAALG